MRLHWLTMKVLGVVLLFSSAALAQTSTGTISGVVKDESGAVVPGSDVTITNVGTGIGVTVTTDSAGRYHVPSLPPGPYEIQTQTSGFQTEIRRGVQLTVGSEVVVNLTLRVGQVTQTTVVTAQAPLVETTTSAVSGLVDEQAIRDLPLNGRSFDQLISLNSAAPTFRLQGHAGTTAVGELYTVAGSRITSNLFLMDGTEGVGGQIDNSLPGGALGKNLGVDAVQEFAVLTSNYSAAYGKRSGGIINIATRSGANELHGSAFEFHRNDNLDARNFFDPGAPPEFKRNQLGGSLGGPLVHDRTFFFGTYETLRERLGQTGIAIVPDANARQGRLPDPRNPGEFLNVGLAPQVRPFLPAIFLPPNGRNFGDGTAEAIFPTSQPSDQDFFLVRVDHRLSEKDSLMGRYNFSDGRTASPESSGLAAQFQESREQMATLEAKRAYARTVNVARFGFSRGHTTLDSRMYNPLDRSLVFLPGTKTIGTIRFSSLSGGPLTSSGTGSSTDRFMAINQFDVSDQIYHYRGAHSLQFGGKLQRIQYNSRFGSVNYGRFEFDSLQSFLLGQATIFEGPEPGGGGDATKAYRLIYLAGYVQDDYKVLPNLTLNLGLRYEVMSVPVEASGNRISNFRVHSENGLRVFDTNPTLGSPFFRSNHNTVAPRIGFAWDPFQNGKTALRGGFGMFYDQIEGEFRNFTASNTPFFSLLGVANPPFPLGFSGATRGVQSVPSPDGLDYDLQVPTRLQWNFGIQQQVTANTMFSVGYSGSHSYHLSRQSDPNSARPQILEGGVYFYPAGSPRRNPRLSSGRFISWDTSSFYQSLSLDFVRRLTHGLRSRISYTHAKNMDDASAFKSPLAQGQAQSTQNPDNPRADRGLSAYDLRNNLVMNFTYDLPAGNLSGAAGRVVGGWQIGGIIGLADGTPMTALAGFRRSRDQANSNADRPNLRAGASNNPVLGGPDRYYDPAAFELQPAGFYGNLGRNTLIAPGVATVDMTLVKIIPLTEQWKLDFRAEFFNLLNRANFGVPDRSVFNSNGTIRGAAGRISSTTTTSRQIQFGLRLLF